MPPHALTRRARLLAALVSGLAVAATLVAADPAAAARWRDHDPVGDVTGEVLDETDLCAPPTPADATGVAGVDITRLAVRHGDRRVRLTLSMDALPEQDPAWVQLHLRSTTGPWLLDLGREGAHHRWRADLSVEPDWEALVAAADPDGDGCAAFSYVEELVSCPALRVSTDPEVARLRVGIPRRCLGSPRWVRAAADVSSWWESDHAMFSDRWSPDGARSTSYVGPFGPRVSAGPAAVVDTPPARSGPRDLHRVDRRVRLLPGDSLMPLPPRS